MQHQNTLFLSKKAPSAHSQYLDFFGFACLFVISSVFFSKLLFYTTPYAYGAPLMYISDTISTSQPSTSTDHTILFQVSSTIPTGGKIIITPDVGHFYIPPELDYTDIDLGTSSALIGSFAERTLGAVSSPSVDGASIISGMNGALTLTLNSSQEISAGTFIRIKIGAHAAFDEIGNAQIINPATSTSYRIRLRTETSGGAMIDEGITMIAVINPISVYADTYDFDPPVRSNGIPTGTIPSGIQNVEISLNTDEGATCRYATSSGVPFASMPNTLEVTGGTLHTQLLTGLTDGTTYTFNVRCVDRIPNANPDDYPISFTVSNPLPPVGPSGGSGGGAGGGGAAPFPTNPSYFQITVAGRAYPGSPVAILQDGTPTTPLVADGNGNFSTIIQNFSQGRYTFSIYATDTANRRSATYSATITTVVGTNNTISGILISPTTALKKNTLELREKAELSGQATPLANIEVRTVAQKSGALFDGDVIKTTTRASATGTWQATIDTSSLPRGTYETKARSVIGSAVSNYSNPLYFGVDQSPAPDFCTRSDINNDSKTNLIDFSILLFNWGSSNATADINLDNRVNLTDFSVMLFCWTG